MLSSEWPMPKAKGLRIGLLGGSFNPAHEGHVHISEWALKKLGLDYVWWLVSPQNPLKSRRGMASLELRMAKAKQLAVHPRIRVTDMEQAIGSRYTADTLAYVTRHYPEAQFVWLMGADNLVQFHRWERWKEIAASMPIAVIDRGSELRRGLRGRAGVSMAPYRLPEGRMKQLPELAAPAWGIVMLPRHPLSATALRKKLGKRAFLRHN